MSIDRIVEHLRQGRLTLTVMEDGSGVLLDVKEEALFSLNPTGLFLIDHIQKGSETMAQLSSELAEHFQIDRDQARSDAEQFLGDLVKTL